MKRKSLTLLLALSWGTAQAATIEVTTTADVIDASGDCSLREAVIAANTNAAVDGCAAGEPLATAVDQILIPAGDYTLTIIGADETWQPSAGTDPYEVVDIPNPAVGDLDLLESVALVGDGSGTTVVRWGAAEDRVFQVAAVGTDDVMAELTGLTITGGHVPVEVINPGDPPEQQWSLRRLGGGMAVGPGASIKLAGTSGSDEGNSGPPDVHTSGGEPSSMLVDVVFDGNSSDGDGGGMFSGGPLTAAAVVWSNNSCAGNGGGLYHEGTLDVQGAGFLYNTAEGGGAMFMTGGTTGVIDRALIRGNYATGGGGLSARALVVVEVTNSTIAENEAFDVGGGLYTNGLFQLDGCSVVDNLAGSDASFGAGGMSTFGGGLFQIGGSLVSGNIAGLAEVNCGCTGGGCNIDTYYTSDGYNLESIDSCGFDQPTDLVSTDPMLWPIALNGGAFETYALQVGSPAIDAGSPICAGADARGLVRPIDGNGDGSSICDIGAFELSMDEVDWDGDGWCAGVDIGGMLWCSDGSMPGDCDDDDDTMFPGNPEFCDGKDNDCANGADDGLLFEDWYADTDGDLYGDPLELVSTCDGAPIGYVADGTDCDDDADTVNPGAIEVCNLGIDDDCDTVADDDDPSVDVTTWTAFFADTDDDGFGDAADTVSACAAPTGYVPDATDCNDLNSGINPGATEVCNTMDDDCDTLVDDDDDSVAATDTFYADGDQDGFGDPNAGLLACVQPAGHVVDDTDCNDTSADINPDATEVCNGIDDDCDNLVDDADDSVEADGTFYADEDQDGFGDPGATVAACEVPDGYVEDSGDCDDADAAVNPDAEEIKNDLDDDCDGAVDKDDDDYTGGCGCAATGSGTAPTGTLLGLIALGGLVRRRRS